MLHDEPSKKILYDLKYYNRRENAGMLAYEAVLREGTTILGWKPDVIIPVPLHKKREIKRGYNQAALLANQFSIYLAEVSSRLIPVDDRYLVRIRKTSPQKELSGNRRQENVRNAFAVSYKDDSCKYAGKTILLVDDIYTSGATLSECARVLKQYGAAKVYCLAFGIGS